MRGELPVRDTRRVPVPGAGSVSGSPSWGSPAGTWPTGFAGHPRVFHGGTARWSEPGRRDRSLPFPEPRQGPGRADKRLGHGARIPPGSGAASRLSHLPFAPGEAPAPRACATAGVGRDLELWPPNTAARSLPGSPLAHSRPGGREPNSTFRGLPPSWPCFPWLRGLGAGGGGECQPGLLDTGPRTQLPSTGGCHSAAEQPGTGTANPRLTPVCPLPRAAGASGLVALGVTLWWWQRGQRRAGCRSGAGVWRGGVPREGVGAPGAAGAAGLGPALRHRCSPNTPDLKRRFQPGAGGRGPVPPAP